MGGRQTDEVAKYIAQRETKDKTTNLKISKWTVSQVTKVARQKKEHISQLTNTHKYHANANDHGLRRCPT